MAGTPTHRNNTATVSLLSLSYHNNKWRAEARGLKGRERGWSSWNGQSAPFPPLQLGSLGSAVEDHPVGSLTEPWQPSVFLYTPNGFSWCFWGRQCTRSFGLYLRGSRVQAPLPICWKFFSHCKKNYAVWYLSVHALWNCVSAHIIIYCIFFLQCKNLFPTFRGGVSLNP